MLAARQFDRAAAVYRDLGKRHPATRNVQYALGRYYVATRQPAEAAAAFEKEIANSPDHVPARLGLAAIKKDSDPAAALAYAEQAVRLNPRVPLGHYLLGSLLLQTPDTTRAIAELELAEQSVREDPGLYYALARAVRPRRTDRGRRTCPRDIPPAHRRAPARREATAMTVRSLAVRAAAIAIALAATAMRANASDYDRHVVFDNSVAPDAYYWGSGSLVAPSSLALAGGKLPVDDRAVRQPSELPAAVVAVPARRRLARDAGPRKHWGGLDYAGDTLSFWATPSRNSPPTRRRWSTSPIRRGEGSPAIRLLGDRPSLPAGTWTRIRLPFRRSSASSSRRATSRFDPRRLASITILQGLDDGVAHTLY